MSRLIPDQSEGVGPAQEFHQGQLSGSQSSSEPLRRRQMLGIPYWWEEPQGPTLVSFAGGLGVSQ